MGCDPVGVTGFVDGELEGPVAAAVERHLAFCPTCAAQAAFEIELRDRLLSLPPIPLRLGLGARLRARVGRPMTMAAAN
jgi:anti-sigma factor RsiW